MTINYENELIDYCRKNPRYYGMFFSALQAGRSRWKLHRSLLGIWRRELMNNLDWWSDAIVDFGNAKILLDASFGGRHAALWMPIAYSLAKRGIAVGLISPKAEIPNDVRTRPEMGDPSLYRYVAMPIMGKHPVSWLRTDVKENSILPWKGLHRSLVIRLQRWVDRMIDQYLELLKKSTVELFVTTEPYSLYTAPMIYAARSLGIKTIYLQQGLPGGGAWYLPAADVAIVWSLLGQDMLRCMGWNETDIIIAINPGVPEHATLQAMRNKRRQILGISSQDFCVLFLGQLDQERGMFAIPGYEKTVKVVGEGLKNVRRPEHLATLLRPHQLDKNRLTEQWLSGVCLDKLVVSNQASLWEDIAAADLVLSMHSTALEEAYLLGRPIVQVVAEGFQLVVDFRVLGIPLIRKAQELSDYVSDFKPMSSPDHCVHLPKAVDVIQKLCQ